MQIDIKEIDEEKSIALGYLYTEERAVKIIMSYRDYTDLIRDGFFIRDGKEKDSANVLNTTLKYLQQKNGI